MDHNLDHNLDHNNVERTRRPAQFLLIALRLGDCPFTLLVASPDHSANQDSDFGGVGDAPQKRARAEVRKTGACNRLWRRTGENANDRVRSA